MMEILQEAKDEMQTHDSEESTELKRMLQLQMSKMESALTWFSQKVTAEIQLNAWFYDGIASVLEKDLNLVVHSHDIHRSLPESLINMYGKSQPDLFFYPYSLQGNEALGGIVFSASDESNDVTANDDTQEFVIGGMAEFKSFKIRCSSQVFANLVRYGVYLAEERLRRGYLIDYIHVLGILGSHHKGMCIPVKLNIDFQSNKTYFMEGEVMSMVEGFVLLVYNMIHFCPP